MQPSREGDAARPRRILLVSLTNFLGGGEIFCSRFAKMLTPEIRVNAIVRNPALHKLLQGVAGSRLLEDSLVADRLLRYVHAAKAMLKEIRVNRPDVIVLNGQGDAYLAPLAKLTGIPTVIIRHTSLDLDSGPFKRAMYRANASLVDSVISVAQHIRDAQASFLPDDRNIFIGNWVPDDIVRKPKSAAPHEVLHVVYSGRLREDKGVLDLCTALHDLEGVTLTVYGIGPLLDSLRAKYAGSNISFPGFIRDPDERYRDAHLFVFPSHSEALPQAVLEASGYGLPCLLSDIPGHREVSGDGEAAILCEVHNPQAVREAVAGLQKNPHALAALAEKGQNIMLGRYGQAIARSRYLNAFEKVWK